MIDEVERDEFSVYAFTPDNRYTRELSFVDAETAKLRAVYLTGEPGVARIIITDGGDHTVFEWRLGEGVTFPPATTTG